MMPYREDELEKLNAKLAEMKKKQDALEKNETSLQWQCDEAKQHVRFMKSFLRLVLCSVVIAIVVVVTIATIETHVPFSRQQANAHAAAVQHMHDLYPDETPRVSCAYFDIEGFVCTVVSGATRRQLGCDGSDDHKGCYER